MENKAISDEKAFLMLLRAGLYDDAGLLHAFPYLSDEVWGRIYAHAVRQTVTGIVCHALSMLPDNKMPPYGLLLKWMAATHKIETAHNGMSAALATLLAAYSGAGLAPVLQKGHAAARFYSRPSLRVCGDIDIYVDAPRTAADAVVESAGATVRHSPDGSSCFRWQGFEVERHSALLHLHSPFRQKTLSRIVQEAAPMQVTVAPGVEASVPAPLAELLMLNIHILKHVLGSGIGLRQVCDYALAYRALMPVVGADRYRAACRSLGIIRWTDTLHRFISTYIPDSAATVAPMRTRGDAAALRHLHSIIIEGGNFGRHRPGAPARSKGTLSRKIDTFTSFLRHGGLTARIAPFEALGIVLSLLRGQIHS